MPKKLSLSLIALCAMVLFGAGCGASDSGGSAVITGNSPTITGDICNAFPTAWVADATGKTIIKTAKPTITAVTACEYYLTETVGGGGKIIDIIHEHLDIEIQKNAREIAGSRWEKGGGFVMDNVLIYDSKGNLTDVDILLGANEYLRINSLQGALTKDELISFGKKVAYYIKSGKAHAVEEVTTEDTSDKTGSADAKGIADTFFSSIGNGDPTSAVELMDANQTTKNMWQQNFAAISSLTVKSLEPTFQSEWTSERESYKATLEVKTKGGNTFGWEDGTNTRWITLQKTEGKWLVHELANNP